MMRFSQDLRIVEDACGIRAIFPVLKDGACRASGQPNPASSTNRDVGFFFAVDKRKSSRALVTAT